MICRIYICVYLLPDAMLSTTGGVASTDFEGNCHVSPNTLNSGVTLLDVFTLVNPVSIRKSHCFLLWKATSHWKKPGKWCRPTPQLISECVAGFATSRVPANHLRSTDAEGAHRRGVESRDFHGLMVELRKKIQEYFWFLRMGGTCTHHLRMWVGSSANFNHKNSVDRFTCAWGDPKTCSDGAFVLS